eukprot:CAMPEP_0168382826 /NCGR_PEP_ID=MMETSP0228-20121227/13591_1 /TAXON_ID=133427 /ORGANISM="Protoceratium reticulatum, Strain CCCM 535 (=CCMP 1889)" /LENGTH=72 /DNA_ID=CAMNT_0008395965 /DNA_START=100 /DNA_END=314 /DNA_ORIENTATION=+
MFKLNSIKTLSDAGTGIIDRAVGAISSRAADHDQRSVWVVALATLCAFLPLEISHLVSLMVGICAFALLQLL